MISPRWIFVGDVGGPATYHVGDEAMLDANLALFRRLIPGLMATVVSADPTYTSSAYDVDAIPPMGFSLPDPAGHEKYLADLIAGSAKDETTPAIKAIRSADGLVISGGGNLSSSWPHHICERVVLAAVARDRGIPVVILGQTIGPNLADRHLKRVGEMLSAAAWVGVRDLPSYALARQLGVKHQNLSYQCDDSISLASESPDQLWAKALAGDDAKPWIAVTIHPISDPGAAGDWLDGLANELDSIARLTGARLVFVPHVAAVDSRTSGDRSVGEALARRMASGRAMEVGEVLTARQTRWLTGHADLVISTRYHPVVFGLAAGVPCLALWTDQYTRTKLEGALIHADRVGDGCDLFALSAGELTERVLALWVVRDRVRASIQAHAARWQQDDNRRTNALGAMLRQADPASDLGHADAGNPVTILDHFAQALHGSIHYFETMQSRSDHMLDTARQHASALAIARDDAVQYAHTLETDRDEAVQYAHKLETDRDKAVQYAHTLEIARDDAVRYAHKLETDRDEAVQYAHTLETDRDEAIRYARSQEHTADEFRQSKAEADRYAASLIAEVNHTRVSAEAQIIARDASFVEAQRYAMSLLSELERLRRLLGHDAAENQDTLAELPKANTGEAQG